MAVRLRDVLDGWSRLKYAGWRLAGRPVRLRCRLASGERLLLRPPPCTDLGTAYEVFVSQVYGRAGELNGVRRVVDLGANVGYTLLLWARLFPAARVVGFEPHPTHQRLIREHLRLNRLDGRVVLVAAAAGVAAGTAVLSDAENISTLGAVDGVRVPVVDVFDTLTDGPIDLLKIDIEGSERELLRDPRFHHLPVAAVVIEWHASSDWPDAEAEVRATLGRMGLRLTDGPRGHHHGVDFGVMWGTR